VRRGTTLHGIQVTRPSEARLPTSYDHPSGPIGRVFAALRGAPGDVALVGLGVGSLAAYAEPGERFTFFEIDPQVVRIARDPAFFTYLRDARGSIEVVAGDGRVALAAVPDGSLGRW
jgi:spermidine synthase